MSAEQTPDIERVLAEHLRLSCSSWPFSCACDPHTQDSRTSHTEHLAQALAPVLTAVVREAEQRALREAADEIDLSADYYPSVSGGISIACTTAEQTAANWLRDRADRVAEPQHEAATSREDA